MILKTYRAASMADALALVKKDLGKDAVILSTRSQRVGGFLGFGGKNVVEITASDQAPMFARGGNQIGTSRGRTRGVDEDAVGAGGGGTRRGPALTLSNVAANAYAAGSATATPVAPSTPPAPRFIPAPELKPDPLAGMWASDRRAEAGAAVPATPATAASALSPASADPRERVQVLPVRSSRLATTSAFAPVDPAASAQIHRELADIKLLVHEVLRSGVSGGAAALAVAGSGTGSSTGTMVSGAMPDALFQHYLRLLEAQVAREIADRVVGAVRDELNPGELGDASIVRTSVLRHLSRLIPVDEHAMRVPSHAERTLEPSKARHAFVVALVGPTGVGKTTTIAKLAAAYKLRHGRSVALITSDTYRIAAVDQLRTYASIIGLNLRVALTPDEMRDAVHELSAHDVILIDTAGRSQHNADRIGELCAFLQAAEPDQTHLVLSSAASEAVLVRTAEAFAAARPDHFLFTKLDEAVNFGVLVNVVQKVSTALGLRAQDGSPVSLSFVTTGQEVPDHIEPGHAERLARAVLDNRFHVEVEREEPSALSPSVATAVGGSGDAAREGVVL